jgi:hypothetical protein
MIWRHELKYLIDEATFQHLYFSLSPILRSDRHTAASLVDGLRAYRIRSLYFDDYSSRGIFDKLAGTDFRHKFRVRIYNDSDRVIHLEKKSKQNSLANKQSCRLSREQVDALLAGDPECLLADAHDQPRDQILLGQFYAEIRCRLLAPRLLVDYERLPLVWPDGNVRITFDRHLATGYYRQDLWDPDAGLQPVLEPGTLIMELKYDHFLPDFIGSLLATTGAYPLSLSKYAQCAGFIRTHSWEDQN